jgi:dimethylhistidine N-methyltransferase
MNSVFKNDVVEGLSKSQKKLPSKYFYDERGDQLFQQIMDMEEYYLPKLEREIIKESSTSILNSVIEGEEKLNVIELGAGDGRKTVEMLAQMRSNSVSLEYFPLDISAHILEVNKDIVEERCPNIKVSPLAGDYFETMKEIKEKNGKKLVLFLGSNIGNYAFDKAVSFLQEVKSNLKEGDFILIAFDLKKNPHKILAAYNDKNDITKAFNLNLLKRINRELDADFELDFFDHYAAYDPLTGRTASYIISLKKQDVQLSSQKFHFKRNEVIHVEVSQKYDFEMIESLSDKGGFEVTEHFMDKEDNYSLSLLKA